MICSECGATKAQLLLSFYCPNGCDDSVDLSPQDWEIENEDDHPYRSAEYIEREPEPLKPTGFGTVGVAPGTVCLKLPDGTRVALSDWVSTTLYSTFVIESGIRFDPIQLFSTGLSQQMLGSRSSKFNTRAHTNIPRCGYSGLPRGWQFYCNGIYAETNYYRGWQVEDWLFTTSASLVCNSKTYLDTPLTPLMSPVLMEHPPEEPKNNEVRNLTMRTSGRTKDFGINLAIPILIRENLAYEVNINSSCSKAQARLADLIRQSDREFYFRLHLDGLLCKPVY